MTAVGVAEAAEKQFEKLQEQLPQVLWAGLLSVGLQIPMHLVHSVPERRQHHQPLCHLLQHSVASVSIGSFAVHKADTIGLCLLPHDMPQSQGHRPFNRIPYQTSSPVHQQWKYELQNAASPVGLNIDLP